MSNLTKTIKPSGFRYYKDFITKKEEKNLLKNLLYLNWQKIEMHGKIARRRVVHYGLDYLYDSRKVKPTTPPPKFLYFLIKRLSKILKINNFDNLEILITEYPPEAGIGWHKDAAVFSDTIVGISLLNSCLMKLRILNKDKNYIIFKKEIEPRSAYILSGASRNVWQHSITPVKNMRYSITFRTLKSGIIR